MANHKLFWHRLFAFLGWSVAVFVLAFVMAVAL